MVYITIKNKKSDVVEHLHRIDIKNPGKKTSENVQTHRLTDTHRKLDKAVKLIIQNINQQRIMD